MDPAVRANASVLAAILAAFIAAGVPAACAGEGQDAKAPASLEEQMQALSSALAESFNGGDWDMLELAAGGAKAAGLKGQDLEVFALRSERDAALAGFGAKNRIILWGLAFRAKLGDERAAAALRTKALARIEPAKMPQAGGGGGASDWAAWQKYQGELTDRANALLALGLLGDKDAGRTAWEALQAAEPSAWSYVPTLTQAVLAADKDEGWKKLFGLCADEAADFARRTAVFGALAGLAGGDRPGNRGQAFRVEGRLAKLLPADAAKELRATFVRLAGKFPEGAESFKCGGLTTGAGVLPGFAEDQAAMDALKGLKGRVKGQPGRSWDMMIDGVLRNLGQPVAGVAKPAQPVNPAPQPGPKETF